MQESSVELISAVDNEKSRINNVNNELYENSDSSYLEINSLTNIVTTRLYAFVAIFLVIYIFTRIIFNDYIVNYGLQTYM